MTLQLTMKGSGQRGTLIKYIEEKGEEKKKKQTRDTVAIIEE